MASRHDQIAKQIAKREGVKYNRGKGGDFIGKKRAIEVETEDMVKDGLQQL